MIYTHLNPDLDAVCSVWAVRKYGKKNMKHPVAFKPADWDGTGFRLGDVIVDIDACGMGVKGHKDADGTVHSAFDELMERHAPVEDRKALRLLMEYEDYQDSKGNALRHFTEGLPRHNRDILNATSIIAVLRALKMALNSDAEVVEAFMPILDGMLIDGRKALAARDALGTAQWVGKVAIIDGGGPLLSEMLFDEGAVAVVYASIHGTGVIRRPNADWRAAVPPLKKLVQAMGEEEFWFEHSSGFLYANGTLKAPTRSPTRLTPVMVATFVNEWLNSEYIGPLEDGPLSRYHQHLKRCNQCLSRPFDLCIEGERLLQQTKHDANRV